jgi:hypothetical protein
MTTSATPAAATEATPAADDSLLPNATDEPQKPAGDATGQKPGETPAEPPPTDPEWFLSEGVKGTGKAPDWYNGKKYKSVAEQAKAQRELEKRLGGFTGAPKDGKYDIKMPEGVEGEWAKDDPLIGEFSKWAAENQLSQDAFNQVLGMYAVAVAVDPAEIKKQIGENADARLMAVSRWGKANLDAEGMQALRAAVSGPTAAYAFQAIEAIIGKTRAGGLKVGDDAANAGTDEATAIRADQNKRNDKGQRLYEIDPKYREQIEVRWRAYHASKAA